MFSIYEEFEGPELLKFLSPVEREMIYQRSEVYQFSRGERVVYQEDSEDVLYLLESGRAEVVVKKDGVDTRLAILEPGESFGEVGFISHRKRTADVFAMDDCSIRIFEPSRLSEAFSQNDSLAARFMLALCQIFSERLSSTLSDG